MILVFKAFDQLSFFFVMAMLFGLELKIEFIFVNIFELAQFLCTRMLVIEVAKHVIHFDLTKASKPVEEVGIIETPATLMNFLHLIFTLGRLSTSLRGDRTLLEHEGSSAVAVVIHQPELFCKAISGHSRDKLSYAVQIELELIASRLFRSLQGFLIVTHLIPVSWDTP